MAEWEDLDNPELKKIFRKYLIRGAIFLFVLILLIFLLALSFEPQLTSMAKWLSTNFGVWGLMAVVFVADLIVSPVPPDAALFFIGKSDLHQSWLVLVPLLGVVSTLAGVAGWYFGKKFQHFKAVKRILETFGEENKGAAKKFGFWMVFLGALTPLPFSITCWLAGIFKLPFRLFISAALFRIPRFVIYYWAIFYSSEIGSWIRTLF